MTTIAEARNAVYQRFLDAAIVAGTKTAFDNESFDQPSDGSTWIRVSVRNNASEQETLGPTKFERRATAYFQVFVPLDTGLNNPDATKSADVITTAIRALYEGTSFSGLKFRAVLIREGRPDGRWFLVVVDAPFVYYEHRP